MGVADKQVCLGMMTWPEVEARLKETDIVLVPVGATEQHAKHATVNLDNLICEGVAIAAAKAAFAAAKPVVAPTIYYGYCDLPKFGDFPGTITLRAETFINLLYDVAHGLVKMGFKKVLFINGHDANPPFVMEACRRIIHDTGAFCGMGHVSELNNNAAAEVLKAHNQPLDWGHACLIETSMAEALGMEVRESGIEANFYKPDGSAIHKLFKQAPRGFSFPAWDNEDVMDHIWGEGTGGAKGDASGHSKELGFELIEATVKPLLEVIENLKNYNPKVII